MIEPGSDKNKTNTKYKKKHKLFSSNIVSITIFTANTKYKKHKNLSSNIYYNSCSSSRLAIHQERKYERRKSTDRVQCIVSSAAYY